MKSVTVVIQPTDDKRMMSFLLGFRQLFPRHMAQVNSMLAEARQGLEITVSAYHPDHTREQRGYYHMWKKAFADYTGCTPDEVHEYLLNECFGSEYKRTMLGIMQRPLKRSSEAKVDEYSELIETLIRVAGEMGFSVPPPLTRIKS